MPCGHEHTYSIYHLTDELPLTCQICNLEVKLPDHVKSAWKNFNLTLLDVLSKALVHAEHFVRENPWAVPIAIGLSIAVGVVGIAVLESRGNMGRYIREKLGLPP